MISSIFFYEYQLLSLGKQFLTVRHLRLGSSKESKGFRQLMCEVISNLHNERYRSTEDKRL